MNRKERVDFILKSPNYRRLHLVVYAVYLLIILVILVLVNWILSFFNMSSLSKLLLSIVVIGCGVFLIFKRDSFVSNLDNYLLSRKIQKRKEGNKEGLKSTLRNIRPKPKRDIKLKVGGKEAIKDRFKNIKKKFSKKKEAKEEYIEIK